MAGAKASYRHFLKALTEYLVGHGFAADRRTFRCANEYGDMVVVEVQISSSSLPGSVEFYVNLALVLAPRWQWDRTRMNLAEGKEPTSSSGLWFGRVGPPGQRGTWRWKIHDDASAIAVLNELCSHLDRELPIWKRFLDRDVLLQNASEQDGIFSGMAWQIRAWLLADQPDNERIIEEILQQAGISASHAVYGPVLEHAARTTTAAHRKETM